MRTSSSGSGWSDPLIPYPEPRFGIRLEGFVIRVSPNMIPLPRTLSRDSWCVARNQDAVRGLGYSLIPESRISIPDSLLGKRGSV